MGVTASVNLTNNFGTVTAEITGRAQQGVALAGERLMALAVDRAPLDQGTLIGSAAVSTPLVSRGADPQATVSFDTPYAARLHEHPEYNFSTDSNPNAQGKYLESAALENKDELGAIIAKQVNGG
jgi:hypothetical protein